MASSSESLALAFGKHVPLWKALGIKLRPAAYISATYLTFSAALGVLQGIFMNNDGMIPREGAPCGNCGRISGWRYWHQYFGVTNSSYPRHYRHHPYPSYFGYPSHYSHHPYPSYFGYPSHYSCYNVVDDIIH